MSPPDSVSVIVERALEADPSLSTTELQEIARAYDNSVTDLSGRQFHAKYALQARRRLKQKSTTMDVAQRQGSVAEDPITELYERQRAELDRAIRTAFARAFQEDSASRVSGLLARLEAEIRYFDSL